MKIFQNSKLKIRILPNQNTQACAKERNSNITSGKKNKKNNKVAENTLIPKTGPTSI